MTNVVVLYHSPDAIRDARDFLSVVMTGRYVRPERQLEILNNFDCMMRRESAPLLDQNPVLRSFVSDVVKHFEIKRRMT